MSNLNSNDQKDKRKIKRIGILLTVLIHGLVIGALAYTYAWVPPDPPIPKKGMSVDLGNFYEARQGKKPKKNDTKKEETPKLEQEKVEEQEEIKAVQEVKPVEEALLTQNEETTPLEVKKAEIKAKEKKPIKKKVTEQVKRKEKKVVKETQTRALEEKGKDLGDGKSKKSDYADAGQKNGKPEGKVKKGLQGENGFSLDLAGWMWLRKPVVNDPTDDSGTITLELTIDKYGNVVSSQIINKTVSLTTANHYKAAIEKSKFKPIKRGSRFSTNTKGTVTFTARVK